MPAPRPQRRRSSGSSVIASLNVAVASGRLLRFDRVPPGLLEHRDARTVLSTPVKQCLPVKKCRPVKTCRPDKECRPDKKCRPDRSHTSSPIIRINSSALLWVITPSRSL